MTFLNWKVFHIFPSFFSDDNYDTSTTPIQLSENKATSLRKREVILSKISIYIVFVFLFCHSLRIIPNMYEMIQTYTKVSFQTRPSNLAMVFCYQNCSDLLWEKIVLVITRTIYSNSEGSEPFLVTECFFNLFLEVSHCW